METERTIFTVLEEKDLPDMTVMAEEPDTFRYIRKLRIMTPEEYQRFLRLKLEQIRLKTGYHWAVRLKDRGAAGMEDRGDFIGAVNLNPIGGTARLQIGCQLKREYWGRGFASELTKRVLEFAIHEAGLKEVYGVFEKDNIVSRRLLAKLGFVWLESLNENGVEAEIHRYEVQDYRYVVQDQ
jgi:[ribosomal protein S5]-alanine N-acetyltransferase